MLEPGVTDHSAESWLAINLLVTDEMVSGVDTLLLVRVQRLAVSEDLVNGDVILH